VCADETNYKVSKYFDEEENGLKQDWGKYTCWCNPPYQDPMPWIEKAEEAAHLGATVVMLLPVDTSTAWFRAAFYGADEIVFLMPRVRFIGAPGSPRWANMLCIWKPTTVGFCRTAPTVHHWSWKQGGVSEPEAEDL